MGWFSAMRVLGALRTGRLIREVEGLRRAVEALVEVVALAAGVPNPLSAAIQAQRKAAGAVPPDISSVNVPLGAYVDAEARRETWEATYGKAAPADMDFMVDESDAAGDATARGAAVTVYPEDFQAPVAPPEPPAADLHGKIMGGD